MVSDAVPWMTPIAVHRHSQTQGMVNDVKWPVSRGGATYVPGWQQWGSTLEWKWKCFVPGAIVPVWCAFMGVP
jgi:hypothetical protein